MNSVEIRNISLSLDLFGLIFHIVRLHENGDLYLKKGDVIVNNFFKSKIKLITIPHQHICEILPLLKKLYMIIAIHDFEITRIFQFLIGI